ncbi:glycosyltransferase 61 family protein [Phaeovulum vinaykumarii]|uniref:Glycosyl transferase family 41 n=1 Tax=Phaeovulum vinaykumarii TaxID=407234 RepID=A0A1N7KD97_9RHOB|nr:glycosyltransferase 61 family protein [Phaeovulum vinaykumarii]SIS59440.1 Glycosyl transferase family 41 [Phaeovulum vinaykumarii]SOB94121.1 glycosyl transferase family 41 [Phaeovulum vinaykumarii]
MTLHSDGPAHPETSPAPARGGPGGDAGPAPSIAALLEGGLSQARTATRHALDTARITEIETRIAPRIETECPLPRIAPRGFDRPATLYLLSGLHAFDGAHRQVAQMIAARPHERHLAILDGHRRETLDWARGHLTRAGALPLSPARAMIGLDRLQWLRAKLAALAVQRIVAMIDADDLIARLALAEVAPVLGDRLYLIHRGTSPADFGPALAGATHVTSAALARAADTGAPTLPEVYTPIRRMAPPDLPPPPQPQGPGRRAAVRFHLERVRRVKPLARAMLLRSIADSPASTLAWRAQTGRARMRAARLAPAITTATGGNAHDFPGSGPLDWVTLIVAVLHHTNGRHVHVGYVEPGLRRRMERALRRAGLDIGQVEIVDGARDIYNGVSARPIDLFVAAYPHADPGGVAEAAAAGAPVALFAPADSAPLGKGANPALFGLWHDAESLAQLARKAAAHRSTARGGGARAKPAAAPGAAGTEALHQAWNRLIAATEGALAQSPDETARARLRPLGLFDADFYRGQFPKGAKLPQDEAAAFTHYLETGAAAGKSPHPLFDPAHYLALLPEAARAAARPDPAAHYLAFGEALGQPPHPLFDPVLCARQLQVPQPDILARYLHTDLGPDGQAPVPHTFFDPDHYRAQLPFPPREGTLLEDFLTRGLSERLDPHPLVEAARLCDPDADYAATLWEWLGHEGHALSPELADRATTPLFAPAHFRAHAPDAYARGAPSALWTHLIEGNSPDVGPHPLVWPHHVERNHPGTLTSAETVIERLMRDTGADLDSHPLIDSAHIRAQAPWITQSRIPPLTAFVEHGVWHNLDPHPWFSTQYYLHSNPDVAAVGMNPLYHYLSGGEQQGRWPHVFFNAPNYYHRYLGAGATVSPLIDYVTRGAGYFWNTLPVDDTFQRSRMDTVRALFAQDPDGGKRSAKLLEQIMMPETGGRHPSLTTESRKLARALPPEDDTQTAGETLGIVERQMQMPPVPVQVLRPPVVAASHIAPPSGDYDSPSGEAAQFRQAIVVAGNDGFITADGTWLDHGFEGFDPDHMELRANGAVVAEAGDRVLLRRFTNGRDIDAGLFACGTYSRNYCHFLLEVLPRALLADAIAPAGVPVLTDDDMPAQHYQALRIALPDRPILRLSRQRSHRVRALYAASMPIVFHDAFGQSDVPADAVRMHPEMLRRLARIGAAIGTDPKAPERLFLHREASVRRLLNAGELHHALGARGFVTANFANLGFAEQVQMIAGAHDIVGQSGAHLANIVFARPGTRIFALFSNAPGTNYTMWSQIGAALDLEVVNVAGPRLIGSSGAGPAAHEHFSVPASQLIPFFPEETETRSPAETSAAFDRLHAMAAEADTLTSAWAIRATATPEGFEHRLAEARDAALSALDAASASQLKTLVTHPFYADPWNKLRSGLAVAPPETAAEKTAVAELEQVFARLADPDAAAQDDTAAALPESARDWRRLILRAMLLCSGWQLPPIANLRALPSDLVAPYLRWLSMQTFTFRPGEDDAYVEHARRLLDWIERQMSADLPLGLRNRISRMAAELDLGALLLIERPMRDVYAARNRVLQHVALSNGSPRSYPRAADGSEGRRRIGILCRTFDKGPDSEAVVSMFRQFDRSKYEIFAYSVGFKDRVVSADPKFAAEFDAVIEHRRSLPDDPAGIRAKLTADRLDLFLYANATTYGLRALDLALFHRIAPVQAVMNSHVPLALGYPAFDAFITGQSDHPEHEIDAADMPETVIRRPGSVICYLTSFLRRKNPPLDRAALGIAPDEVVMMNAGSYQKLRHDCLTTMMRAVARTPNAVLLLAPYNPGWAARSQAFCFNRQLAEAAAEVGLDPARIRITSELTVAEAEAALSCADVYLNPFPHGGATMTHLALIYGVPPVTLRRRSTRSIDQFLIGSLGATELLADTPADYVELAHVLATDPARRAALSARLREAARQPVFVDNPEYSRDLQATFTALLDRASH